MSIGMRAWVAVLVFALAELPVFAQTAVLRAGSGPPEDPQLRAEAVRLVERANHLSTPAVWPPNVLTLRFHVPNPAPGDPYDGEYVSSVGGFKLRRQEWHYGAYQVTQIRDGDRFNGNQSKAPMPGILQVLNHVAPIYLVHFDGQDIVRSITEPVEGTRCIQFDTVAGDHEQANEICVDGQHGWLLSIRTGDTTTKDSNYFPFQGSFLPGHIERWVGGQEVMAVDETDVLKDDYPPDFFTLPANATGFACPELRPPFPVNTPQPPQQSSSIAVVDVQLEGYVTDTGHVFGLRALELLYPELNEEAIKLVSTWTYTPSSCAGKVGWFYTTFTVRFKGR
jgi:hypothetical protein